MVVVGGSLLGWVEWSGGGIATSWKFDVQSYSTMYVGNE